MTTAKDLLSTDTRATPSTPSARSIELAVVALEAAAQACQSGASLRQRTRLDPLAREYLIAAQEIERLSGDTQ